MRIVGVIFFVLAIAAGVYLIAGRNDEEEGGATALPTEGPAAPTPTPPASDGGLETAATPGAPTKPELKVLQTPGRLLMVGRFPTSLSLLFEGSFKGLKDLEYRTWYMIDPHQSEPGAGRAGSGRGLSPLGGPPDEAFLEREDIQVLVFDQADPNSFSPIFWDVVAQRVRSGRMGLFFRPGIPVGEDDQGLSAHPALSHPVLEELLPVARALALEGTPVPGTFGTPQPLRVTRDGMVHPATRLLEKEAASKDAWAAASQGEGALASVFCYPVEEIKPGAQTLVTLAAAVPIPAVVATTGKTRVLWMGNGDFGQRTYFVREKDLFQRLVINHWWVWLIGQM